MNKRCETCPAQVLCADIIQADTATIERRQTIMDNIGLNVVEAEMLNSTGQALIDTHIAELESSLDSDADGASIGDIMEQYATLELKRHTCEKSLASIQATADHLTLICQGLIQQAEAHRATALQLQDLTALGCEQGPSGTTCGAPGAEDIRAALRAVPILMPDMGRPF
jgi:hypothetical protein